MTVPAFAPFLSVRTLALLGLVGAGWGQAAEPSLFAGADLALGAQLVEQHRCAACHTRHVGGDGSAIYRPQGRIHSPGLLRGMVDNCSQQLNLQLFPDEVTAIAAVLNQRHYHFRQP